MKAAVTGAFGYSGRYIAARFIAAGHKVITLTNSVKRENSFGSKIEARPMNFSASKELTRSLEGIDVLVNTYWVRFDHRLFTHEEAVQNTRTLFQAARSAGVGRIVHVSITNPDLHSELPYFAGKAKVEMALQELNVPYSILRPAVLYGKEDVLINNIAWGLRHMPCFGIFGGGDYKLQPIYVDDLAQAAVLAAETRGSEIINAIGPETFTYRGLITTIQKAIGVRRPVVSVSPEVGYWATKFLGMFLRDIVITREEIQGLMENRLYVDAPAIGKTLLSKWATENADRLGRRYTSEMARRVDRRNAYRSN